MISPESHQLSLLERVKTLEDWQDDFERRFKAAAHDLRRDKEFMQPAGHSLASFIWEHWANTAGRKLLLALGSMLAVIGAGVLLIFIGRGFT